MKRFLDDIEDRQERRTDSCIALPLSRREFVFRGSSALVLSSASPGLLLALDDGPDNAPAAALFSAKQTRNLAAVQTHLFPATADAPGADDINALAYLRFVMNQPDFETGTRDFVFRGLQSLHEAGMERFEREFHRLDFSQKESLLRYLADRTRWGRNWLSLLLKYILEALLTDPVYGGNPDGVGWKWLEHQAGFPRPPADKVYTRLRAQAARTNRPTPSRSLDGL
ncbi:MAG: gluconate 2-dehydrogenase subunit 3 family protein [Xanthomonadales bacterium]|nr:gluconate 2-dehydrogenase subunit 3 family protein [Xanthomonadales bacterium]